MTLRDVMNQDERPRAECVRAMLITHDWITRRAVDNHLSGTQDCVPEGRETKYGPMH